MLLYFLLFEHIIVFMEKKWLLSDELKEDKEYKKLNFEDQLIVEMKKCVQDCGGEGEVLFVAWRCSETDGGEWLGRGRSWQIEKVSHFFLYTVVGGGWLLVGREGMKINMWGVEECGLGEQWLKVMALMDACGAERW